VSGNGEGKAQERCPEREKGKKKKRGPICSSERVLSRKKLRKAKCSGKLKTPTSVLLKKKRSREKKETDLMPFRPEKKSKRTAYRRRKKKEREAGSPVLNTPNITASSREEKNGEVVGRYFGKKRGGREKRRHCRPLHYALLNQEKKNYKPFSERGEKGREDKRSSALYPQPFAEKTCHAGEKKRSLNGNVPSLSFMRAA